MDEQSGSAGELVFPSAALSQFVIAGFRVVRVFRWLSGYKPTMNRATPNWREHGVRIVRGDELDLNTPQTQGMTRAAAVTHAAAGANKLWAGTVTIEPDAKTGAHHHGELESVIYVVSGRARMRWGEQLEFFAEAGPGDFIYVPPYVPHQEINAKADEPLMCVVVRSGQAPIVVNLEIPAVERPEEVFWVDSLHPKP
jgi:uncharacterized RmlC-like cupin family protein